MGIRYSLFRVEECIMAAFVVTLNLVLLLGSIGLGITLAVLAIKCMLKYLRDDRK